MIAVIFEVVLDDGQGGDAGRDGAARRAEYLEIAARLRPLLEEVEGFLSIERFQSLSDPDKLLSLSFWRDEAAVAHWRRLSDHRVAQAAGRGGIFADYRLRIAEVSRDYGLNDRAQAPADSRTAHDGV